MKKMRSERRPVRWQPFLNRLNILLLLIFVAFSVLVFRLGYLQLVNGKTFEELVHLTETNVAKVGVPRGLILDRQGDILVGNEGLPAIGYTRGPKTTAQDMVKTAERLAKYIRMDSDGLTERDLKDYFMVKNEEAVNERLSDEDKELKDAELYERQLSKITRKDLHQLSEEDKVVAKIFKQMNAAFAFSTTLIKNKNVTNAEIARVSEHQSQLPGISTTMDWQRSYPYDGLLRSILGGVTTEKQGLPHERVNSYLAKGYARNDRVGNSYIEAQYEDSLRGAKEKYETEINSEGQLISIDQKYAGKAGNSLRLTIDRQFQEKVEDILSDYLENRRGGESKQIYAVASNPKTGEILAMSGKQRDEDGQVLDDALGTMNGSFTMGSTIKGATIAAGYYYDELSLDRDNQFLDQALKFSGTPIKASWWYKQDPNRQVLLDDKQALTVSSNVYMIRLAMAIGGLHDYEEGMTLENLDPDLGNKLRHVYHQFGLGVSTGIDLQNESRGLSGGEQDPGSYLDMAFGQFDTYTPLQLNQYMATIANQGARMKLHLLKEILETNNQTGNEESPNKIIYQQSPILLNQVDLKLEEIKQIQEGFWDVVHNPDGTGYRALGDFPVEVAGKTGTAETGQRGLIHSTFAGYAPYDDPEIAISVVIPNISEHGLESTAVSVGRDIFAAYFDVQKEQEAMADEDQPNEDGANPLDNEEDPNAVPTDGETQNSDAATSNQQNDEDEEGSNQPAVSGQ